MGTSLKRITLFSLLGLIPLFLLAALLMSRVSFNRVKPLPDRLVYSVYCVNHQYKIIGRTQGEPYSSYGGCKLRGDHIGLAAPEKADEPGARATPESSLSDPLTAAEEEVNDLGGVGAFCSCDHKLYAYCINRRVYVSELSPAVIELDSNSCEQAETEPTKGREDTTSCECPKPAASAKTGDAQGGGWPWLGFTLLVSFVALLIFLRLKQPADQPERILDQGGRP